MPRLSVLLVTAVLLVASGTAAWAIRSQGAFRISQNRLGDLPRTILRYHGVDDRFEDSVYAVLANDFNLLRRYLDPEGRIIWLYIGYYGTAKGGRPTHVPQYCYTGQGFAVEDWSLIPAPEGRPGERINRMVVKRGPERQLVYFWFHSDADKILGTGIDQNLLRLRNRLWGRRDDGSLVRLSMSIPPGQDRQVSEELLAFASKLLRLLPSVWPVETRTRS
jgi:EpsI family protein